jgi:ubiquinone/menaquinone biosynthesis C-methylase UbiE
MGFYERRILPKLIDGGMRNKVMTAERPKVAALAEKRVLEIGMGSGLNIPHYTDKVERLYGIEPSKILREKAKALADAAPFPVEFIGETGEDIPMEDHSVNTILTSWTLCSIPNLSQALYEMRRVLKPEGRMIFIEHGAAPDQNVLKWQNRLAPIFRVIAGCNINRPMEDLIGEAGFRFVDLEMRYLDGPRILGYHYIGQAQPS